MSLQCLRSRRTAARSAGRWFKICASLDVVSMPSFSNSIKVAQLFWKVRAGAGTSIAYAGPVVRKRGESRQPPTFRNS